MEPALAGLLAASALLSLLATAITRRDRVVASALGSLAAGSVARSASPSARRTLVARLGRGRIARRFAHLERLASLLDAAGSSTSPEEVAGRKVAFAVAAGALALLSPVPVLAPVLAPVAFGTPDIALRRAAARRLARADLELPQFLDLLAASSSAGLSGPIALRRAVGPLRGPLGDELTRAVRAADLGGRWRDELRLAAERLPLPDLSRTVSTLTRSERLGSPLAEALASLAADVREARRSALAERARKAPVKMLFPLVFLVLPAFLLLTVVPVLLTTLRSIH